MPLPTRQGLYDPAFEHDACGLGFVATLRREATHEVVRQALEILENLTHRGAAGCDPCTEYLTQMRRTIELIGAAEPLDAPPDELVNRLADAFDRRR